MRACTQSQAHTHAHIQAESLTKLFPAGSALAKVFEAQELKEKAQELKEKEKEKAQELKEKEKAQELKEKEKAQELKEKEKAQELKEKEEARELKEKERDDALKKREEEVKQRLDILSLAVGILVFLLLAQSHGILGALNTVFKSVLRI